MICLVYRWLYQLVQLVKSLMVEYEIWGSILAYTKNWLVSWSDDKELSSGADAISWNSLSKNKKEENRRENGWEHSISSNWKENKEWEIVTVKCLNYPLLFIRVGCSFFFFFFFFFYFSKEDKVLNSILNYVDMCFFCFAVLFLSFFFKFFWMWIYIYIYIFFFWTWFFFFFYNKFR